MIVPKQIIELMQPFDFDSMYELGNKKTKGVPYSVYYIDLGIVYDSIDLNGLDGALKLDLRKPIDLEPRKMVTNIGTSEHILEQKPVFENMHNLSNYRIVHGVPRLNSWKGHGYWEYTKRFFIRLAELNNYKIEKLYFDDYWKIICCSYKKKNIQFKWSNKLYKYLKRKQGKGGVSYC